MALFNVIKYDGGPDVFAWKHPNQELGTWTQLIVSESQEAVLFKSGKALDVFQAGRHTLDTANIPLLNKIINLPFGGRSPFTAEVWYVNKVNSLDVKWGTNTPIQLQDPKYDVFVPVRAFGQFGIRIEDSKKFLVKLVGTLPVFDQSSLVKYFRGLYLTKVKDSISSYLIKKETSIMEINAYIDELSTFAKERMEPVLEEYGIRLVNFYINDISVPEDDSAVSQLKAALAKKAEMNIIGYNYQQERSFNTLEGAAKNPGTASNLMGAGLGLGMGVNVGRTIGNEMGGISKQINTNAEDTKVCPKCGALMSKNKRFCPDCGCDTQNSAADKKDDSIVCSKCGNKYKKAKFCSECGKQYNPCPKCGADMSEGSTKCNACGHELAKKCPHCGAQLSSNDNKFCPECGKSLVKNCPKCSAVINGNPKFCPECGEKL
ncbi:MAG: SPFH domain-containing protein [Erysipelotrichaceae bacterium]|nr:SPFH domain-containing protein [Erysipelotrichaceae bacterium]